MRFHRIPTSALLGLVMLAPLPGQEGQPGKDDQDDKKIDKSGARPMPLHRPLTGFTPQDALRHLVQGNRVMLAATRPKHGRPHAPQPLRRPAGAGQHVVAVAQGVGHPRTPGDIFAMRHKDLLLLTSPGPCLRNAEVAALEHAVRNERLSLLAILVRPGDPALQAPDKDASPARLALWRNVEAAHKLAKAGGVSLGEAHGLMQAEVLWRLSPYLRAQRQAERFRIAIGIVETGTGRVQWVTRWHKVPPLLTPSAGR